MDFQDKIAHFGIILSGVLVYGLVMGLAKSKFPLDLELILDSLKPFLSPTYTYDFFVEVMSRDYFINDHLLMDKTVISLAIVIVFYSPFLSLVIIVINLLKLLEDSSILGYLFIPMVISVGLLWTLIVCSVIFSIIPTLIKGLFN